MSDNDNDNDPEVLKAKAHALLESAATALHREIELDRVTGFMMLGVGYDSDEHSYIVSGKGFV